MPETQEAMDIEQYVAIIKWSSISDRYSSRTVNVHSDEEEDEIQVVSGPEVSPKFHALKDMFWEERMDILSLP